MIVQKALAAKNLKESQKGAIYLSLFKVFGPLFTVLPGVVAYNYFNGSIKTPDNAYPALVSSVLPDWAFGLFGAVIFGAILSSFVGSLNSTTTLLTLDFYKPIFGKNKSDKHIACRSHCDNRYWRNCSRACASHFIIPKWFIRCCTTIQWCLQYASTRTCVSRILF